MKKILLFTILLLINCGSSTTTGVFTDPILTAIDSTNDRLFVLEKNGVLFSLPASTQEDVEYEALVDDETNTSINTLLPTSPTNMSVMASGSTSRLFITGIQLDDSGNGITNRILVLEFDGSTMAAASFSPMTVSDDNDETIDTDDILGGLEVDATNSVLYATNSSTGLLYSYSTSDGTAVQAAVRLTGTPNKMSLLGNRLFVANAAEAEAVAEGEAEDIEAISVVNTDDLSVTEIDMSTPTEDVSVLSNDFGTVLLAKPATGLERVLIHAIDTDTYAASSAIAVNDDSGADGQIISGSGITSAVGDILLTKNSSGIIYGYVPQADGNIELITFASDLSSYTASALSTATNILEGITVYVDTSGIGQKVYMVASGSGDLVYTDVGSDEVGAVY